MPRTQIVLDIELEGRDQLVRVTADQRDIAAAEAADADKKFTEARFLAWSAARRAGLYKESWDQFNTRDAVEVVHASITDGDAEAVDRLDPGPRDQSAGG